MAELTIRLRKDPETGKHDILIDLKSDEDALPHEHENEIAMFRPQCRLMN